MLPYEIHITVREPPSIEAFRQFCLSNYVKPIILDLQNRTGTTVLKDVMTSQRLRAVSDVWAAQRALHTTQILTSLGFNPVRCKIETSPDHPQAPKSIDECSFTDWGNHYFEAHILLNETSSDKDVDLSIEAWRYNLHLSRNIFKTEPDGSKTIMATFRWTHVTSAQFVREVDFIVARLRYRGVAVVKTPEVDFVLWDSNVKHDAAWIGAE